MFWNKERFKESARKAAIMAVVATIVILFAAAAFAAVGLIVSGKIFIGCVVLVLDIFLTAFVYNMLD